MKAPEGIQTATLYTYQLNNTLERLQKSKTMNEQLTIEDRVMFNGHSSTYDFTKYNHFEIVDMFERCRRKHNLNVKEFSEMAKYSRCCYIQKVKNQHRFSYASFNRFKDICNHLENSLDRKPIYAPLENANNKMLELNEEMCINFLKETGKYKISKSEIITNWIEL